MGRARKTRAEHERNGTFEKHPEREAQYANEPKPDGPLGPPPASFDGDSFTGAKLIEIWHEIVSQAPPGVLTVSDRIHVEMLCRLTHRIRTSPSSAKSGDFNTVEKLLGKMAMNPADRSKVQIGTGAAKADGDEENNPFAQLANETASGARPN